MSIRSILITGNGFDRQCNLKTSYDEFFNSLSEEFSGVFELVNSWMRADYGRFKSTPMTSNQRENELKRVRIKIQDLLLSFTPDKFTGIDIWMLIFNYLNDKIKTDKRWVDIELLLKYFIMDEKEAGSFNSSNLHKRILSNERNDFPTQDFDLYILSKIMDKLLNAKFENNELFNRSIYLYKEFKSSGNSTLFYDFLLNELLRFEEKLKVYIYNECISNKDEYNQNAIELYKRVLKSNINTCYLLNFNYTLPDFKMGKDGNNVHGYIGEHDSMNKNHVIIGFDQWRTNSVRADDKLFDENTYIFTKTFRKLFQKTTLNVQTLPSKESLERIYFYGHSLGDSDYSYFFSLFDYYSLYDSKVVLEFAYTLFVSVPGNVIIESLRRSITRLILTYGTTMANKDHGKNLLHKLLLENRIVFTEIADLKIVLQPIIVQDEENFDEVQSVLDYGT